MKSTHSSGALRKEFCQRQVVQDLLFIRSNLPFARLFLNFSASSPPALEVSFWVRYIFFLKYRKYTSRDLLTTQFFIQVKMNKWFMKM